METAEFRAAYKNLNAGQKEAVDTIEGPVMVVAGPGTGKTQVLTVRIANILAKTQVEPENILALTFTESACRNMRIRLANLIGTQAYKVEIATFHGFANRIIQDFPEEFPGLVGANAITELEQVEFLEKIILEEELVLLRPFGDQLYYVRPLLGAINDLKKEGVRPVDFEKAVNLQLENFAKIEDKYHDKGAHKDKMKLKYADLERSIAKNQELVKVFTRYQEELAKSRFYDFSDMLIEVLLVMDKKGGLLSGLQEKYQYILVDEHQDTNNAQNKIVENLASFFAPNPNLFVVGDEKQAIFRFQGATIENFLYFKKLYPSAKLISLTDNYRSSQRILDASGSLIRKNLSVDVLVEKSSFLRANYEGEEVKIRVAALAEEWLESQWVAGEVEKLIAGGVSAEEIAIIVRQNRDFEEICRVLSNKGIKYSVSSNQDVLADKWVDQLVTILRMIKAYDFDSSMSSDWLMTKLLHFEIFEIDPMSVYKILKERARVRGSLIEVLDDGEALKKLELVDLEKIRQVVNLLKVWVGVAGNETLSTLFVQVFNDSALRDKILNQPNSIEILGKFKDIFEDLKNKLSQDKELNLSKYLNYLDLLKSHKLGISSNSEVSVIGAVRLMTAHKAKGLEFDAVFLTQCVDGHWGNSRKRSGLFKLPWEELGVKLEIGENIDEIEDERRLFYVGLTRARKNVFVSYAKLSNEGKEQLPSQFLSEIDSEHIEDIDVSAFENNMAGHLEVIFDAKSLSTEGAEREYVRKIFLEQGLSVTSLGNYLECPWKYFYRNLLQLPDVKNKYMVFGSAVHLAISKYIVSIKSEERLSLPDVKTIALEYLQKEPLTKRDYQDLVAKCNKSLDIFFEERMRQWDENRESELRVRGVKLSEEVTINGVIDMIESFADSDPSTSLGKYLVVVTDFKTGRVKSRGEISDAEGDYNYQRQLTFYKLLLDNYQYKKMRVAEGVIDFVEADSKGNLHREVFEVTDEDATNLKGVVLGVADEIMNLKFWDRYCDNEGCEYCELRRLTIKAG